jgi:predicted MFS family arabinose efflux permease
MTRKELTAACLMSTAGAIVYLISPVLVGSAMDSLGLSSEQAGLLIASYFVGYTLVTISAVAWLSRVNLRTTALISSIVFIAALLIATTQTTLLGSITSMIIAGSGAGMLYGISITIVGQSDDPDRYFGIALASQLLFGSVLLFAGPAWIGPNWGYAGILTATAVFVALMSVATSWTPVAIAKGPVTASGEPVKVPTAYVLVSIVAVLVWFTGYSGIYAFVERIGVDGGLNGQQIGLVLSLTIITGLTGALGAGWLGDRYGKLKPHLAGAIGAAITIFLLSGQPALLRYSLAIVFLTLSINFWLAYMLGAVAAIDTSGRYAVLTTAALGLGATIGPGIAGGLINGSDFTRMFTFAAVTIVAGLIVITNLLRRLEAASAAPSDLSESP